MAIDCFATTFCIVLLIFNLKYFKVIHEKKKSNFFFLIPATIWEGNTYFYLIRIKRRKEEKKQKTTYGTLSLKQSIMQFFLTEWGL